MNSYDTSGSCADSVTSNGGAYADGNGDSCETRRTSGIFNDCDVKYSDGRPSTHCCGLCGGGKDKTVRFIMGVVDANDGQYTDTENNFAVYYVETSQSEYTLSSILDVTQSKFDETSPDFTVFFQLHNTDTNKDHIAKSHLKYNEATNELE